MVSDFNDAFLDGIDGSESNKTSGERIESSTLANKKAQEQAQRNLRARQRIDALKEKKHLKDLLDDSEDW